MDSILTQMLKKYNPQNTEEKKNAVKEIIQEIVLCGLSRAGFFRKAAFYGGTALRIFYGLDRFSEDLDFSLITEDTDFSLAEYFPMLEKEIASYGMNLTISEKEKSVDSGIRSAFLKGNTKEHILLFYAEDITGVAGSELIKIKFEVDIMPPKGATFEHKYRLLPAPYEINLYDMPSLFAGKVHAVICRAWKNRVKGRDLYDYIFYLQQDASINLPHLKARLVESGVWEDSKPFLLEDAKRLLNERFAAIDYVSAKDDVRPFIKNHDSLELWSCDFFNQITDQMLK